MFKILASVLILALLPTAVLAQAQAPTVRWGMEARPAWVKGTADLRDDQARLNASRTLAEFTVSAVSPGLARAKYTLVTGFGNADTIMPSGPLQIGGTDFGSKSPSNPPLPKGGQGGFSDKPVNIAWQADVTHRFELVGPSILATRNVGQAFQPASRLRPAAIAELNSSTLTAIGEKDGKSVQECETFRRWLIGLGGEAIYATRYERARALVVASDRYLFADLSYFQRIVPWAALGGGFRHEMKLLDGVRIRVNGLWLGAEIAL